MLAVLVGALSLFAAARKPASPSESPRRPDPRPRRPRARLSRLLPAFALLLCGLHLLAAAPAAAQVTPPSVPRNVQVTPGDAKLTLTWQAPSSWGTWDAVGFDVNWKLTSASASLWAVIRTGGGPGVVDLGTQVLPDESTTNVEVTGYQHNSHHESSLVTNGTAYDLRIRAVSQQSGTMGDMDSHFRFSSWVTLSNLVPGVPQSISTVTVTPGAGKLDLSWTAPTSTVSAITGYDVHYTSAAVGTVADGADASGNDPSAAWVDASHTGTTASQTIPDLTPGTAYRVRARAVNTHGNAAWAFGTGTPSFPAPTDLVVTPGNTNLVLSWVAPTVTVTGYDVHYTASTTVAADATVGTTVATEWVDASHTGTTASKTISSLTNNTTYRVRVRAKNTGGSSAWLHGTGTPVLVAKPSVPQNVQVAAGDGKLTLSWQAPSSWGSGSDRAYYLSWKHKGQSRWGQVAGPGIRVGHASTLASDATSFEFTGSQEDHENQRYTVTNGVPYDLRILAGTSVGDSGWVTVSGTAPQSTTTVPVAVAPSAPGNLGIEVGDGKLVLHWDAPSQGEVTGYDLEFKEQGAPNRRAPTDWRGHAHPSAGWVHRSAAAGALRHDIPNLDNGTTYDVRIRARSIAGPSPWAQGWGRSPSGLSAPADLTVTPGNAKLDLSWTAPSGTVTGYDVHYTAATGVADHAQATNRSGGWRRVSRSGTTTSQTIPNRNNDTAYRVRVRARDAEGAGPWAFGTGTPREADTTVPEAPTFNPLDGATVTDVSTNITLTFTEAVKKDNSNMDFSGHSDLASVLTLKRTDASGMDIPYSASINSANTAITIDPTSNLADGAVYVAISNGYYNEHGNQGEAASATFTVDPPSTDPPTNQPTDRQTPPERSGDASLSSLEIEEASLDFDPGTYTYTVGVYGVTSVTLTPTANHEEAEITVTVNGETVEKEGTSYPVTLNDEGETTITIVVTAEDGTTKTYTLTVMSCPGEERKILEMFYDRTQKEDMWKQNDGWKIENDLHNWHGVRTENGRVTVLSLPYNGLSGDIPSALVCFEELEELSELALWGNDDLEGRCAGRNLYWLSRERR